MKTTILFLLLLPVLSFGQDATYETGIRSFRKNYIETHGAVKAADRGYLSFFTPDKNYVVSARFERIEEAPWFGISTSSGMKKPYRVYGILHFTLHDTSLTLHVYESKDLMQVKKYADHLFVPFTDLTNGEETYEIGRYIEIMKSEITEGTCTLDFNKAYNPYCAYESGKYSCPVPPKENNLQVAIRAGEMKFARH